MLGGVGCPVGVLRPAVFMRFTAKYCGESQSRLVEGSTEGSGSDFCATAGNQFRPLYPDERQRAAWQASLTVL